MDQAKPTNPESSLDTSHVPRLSEAFKEKPREAEGGVVPEDVGQQQGQNGEGAPKSNKRRLFGFGKKKDEDTNLKLNDEAPTASHPGPRSAPLDVRHSPPLPHSSTHPYQSPYSPNRQLSSSSPNQPSPASSQIFERSVQDEGLPVATSPAIPAHIQTENHIPPVLEASSLAITDDHLNPDDVEIVMHSGHQPAGVTVTGTGPNDPQGNPAVEEPSPHHDNDDGASGYGALDTNDVRRLSFISFADVVQGEHAEQSTGHDSAHMVGLSTMSPLINRSPSPVRSPGSPPVLGGSPPTSGAPSFRGRDMSPGRGLTSPGSPASAHSPTHAGELTIETMRQALRKTGSGDLSVGRSHASSAVGGDDVASENHWRQ
ncbi:MAG: hypothetical protein M1833_005202 [Piccolia ochrophora]|nr:MAG: hypothetical protein M1833_005202 [Piccolia ochrophora]